MTKDELRRSARTLLAALTPAARDAASAEIAARVWEVAAVAGAGTLLLFAGRRDEVQTDVIAAEARRRGIRVAYPRIQDEPGAMTLHRVDGPGELVPGRHRIREPAADAAIVPPAEVDAALVPGLAWDRAGGRLGRGAGYFDRLFAGPAWRGFRCGVFFACQEVPAVPREPWDAALDAVVTEQEVWTASRWGSVPDGPLFTGDDYQLVAEAAHREEERRRWFREATGCEAPEDDQLERLADLGRRIARYLRQTGQG